MPLDQPLTTDIHETIIILPRGGIHAQGLIHEGPQPPSALIDGVCHPLQAAAARQGRPFRLSIAHPAGRVEHHQITADGTIHPEQPRTPDAQAIDPIWGQGIPEESGLLEHVRAAQRAGKWSAARQAAHRATQHLTAQHGREHPYAAMGLELQAHFALQAEDNTTAASLSTEAALAIHRLDGPPVQCRFHLANAVAAWLHSDRDTRPGGPGYTIAHALIRVTPNDHAALAALLRRLTKDRP
ncbi:hypothetical protein SMD44_p10054 (plasmid) [Streptomyces alboflavus]|uniref:Uncharacterized protein n=1 Tax=Streptomyces alboflavus TaxID=67267 RepID=A0A291W3S5_9ACTN|nr:hypothetical protein [Streptomyces alboflavus]ATM24553.1 hypothetical protein SMD44_p10054 [Streptomyces alboflavus]